MFEQPVEKKFSALQFNASPSGSVTVVALDYSRIGNVIHGQLVLSPSATGSLVSARIPIKSYFAISVARATGVGGAISYTTTPSTDGFLAVRFTPTAVTPYVIRIIGSDSRVLLAGDPTGSRSLLYPASGVDYIPPLVKVSGAGTISNVSGTYRVPRSPVKLVMGKFDTSGAVNARFNLGAGSQVYESFFGQSDGSVMATGSVGSGGVTLVVPGAGTFLFVILYMEKG